MLSPPNDSIGLGKYTLSVYEIYNIFVCVFLNIFVVPISLLCLSTIAILAIPSRYRWKMVYIEYFVV